MKKQWRAAAAIGLMILLAGCSGKDKKETPGGGETSSRTESLSAEEMAGSAEEAMLSGAESAEPLPESLPETPSPTPSPTPVPTFTIPSLDGAYQVDVPNDWQNMQGQMDDAGREFPIEAGSYDNQVFLLVSREPKSGSPFDSLDAFYQALVRRITNNRCLSEVQIFKPSSILLEKSGLTGRKVLFTAMYDPAYGVPVDESAPEEPARSLQRIAYRIYVTEDTNWFYQFCGWTTGVNAVATEEVFDSVVSSLQISA